MIKFICILFIFTSITYAKDNFLASINIEKDIEKQITQRVSHILDEKDFIISIKVQNKEVKNAHSNFSNQKVDILPLSKFDLFAETIEVSEKDKEDQVIIDRITATIFLVDSISQVKEKEISSLLTKTFNQFGPHKINYSFDRFSKTNSKAATKPKSPLSDHKFMTFAIIASAFLMVILFGITRMQKTSMKLIDSLDKIGKDSETNITNHIESDNNSLSGASQDNNTEPDTESAETKEEIKETALENAMEIEMTKSEGVKRFISYIQDNPKAAANQLRKWLLLDSDVSLNSISLILRSLEFDTLRKLIDQFEPSEKSSLKNIMVNYQDHNLKKAANNFILNNIIDTIIGTEVHIDTQLQESLYGTDFEKLVDISSHDPKLGAEMMAILPENVSNDICKLLDDRTFAEVMNHSFNFNEITKDFTNLKSALRTAPKKDFVTLSPIFNFTVDMLKEASPQKEQIIIDGLAKTKKYEDFKSIMYKNLPVQLFDKLPSQVFQHTLRSIDKNLRAEYLSILSNEKREFYLELLGHKGSKAREICEAEVRKYLDNNSLLDTIKLKERVLTQRFNKEIRLRVSSGRYHNEVNKILNDWIRANYEELSEKIQLIA